MSGGERALDSLSRVSAVDARSATGNMEEELYLSGKHVEREKIQMEVEAFLKGGGKITCVDTSTMSDPPRRPESNYGGQPI